MSSYGWVIVDGVFQFSGGISVVSGVLKIADGTVAAPSFAFTNAATSGLFLSGGVPHMSVGGTDTYVFGASTFQTNTGIITNGGIQLPINYSVQWGTDTGISRLSAGVLAFGTATPGDFTGNLKFTTATQIGLTAFYNGIATTGWGLGAIYAEARVSAVTNTGSASIATYTVGAADGAFRVSANALVTTSTAHSFSLDCVYTDTSNVSRTLVLPVAQLAGTFLTTGLITNATGTGPYETATMHIRCKASTSITIRTSSGGTFTGVVYNAEGCIEQIA